MRLTAPLMSYAVLGLYMLLNNSWAREVNALQRQRTRILTNHLAPPAARHLKTDASGGDTEIALQDATTNAEHDARMASEQAGRALQAAQEAMNEVENTPSVGIPPSGSGLDPRAAAASDLFTAHQERKLAQDLLKEAMENAKRAAGEATMAEADAKAGQAAMQEHAGNAALKPLSSAIKKAAVAGLDATHSQRDTEQYMSSFLQRALEITRHALSLTEAASAMESATATTGSAPLLTPATVSPLPIAPISPVGAPQA